MKNLILSIVFLISSVTAFSQSVFDKLEGKDDVTSVIVNKKMFQMLGSVKVDSGDESAKRFLELTKKLENLKVFTTSNVQQAAEMKSMVTSYLKSNPLEELMRINDEGSKVNIYVKSGSSEKIVKELLMFVESPNKSDETVVLSLTGNFNLDEISDLADQMNIPGGDELKKASKK